MQAPFGHEKLRVYQRGLSFVTWTESLLAGVDRTIAALDHLDRASASIVESIANGNSRRAAADRNRYFDVALGSALECAACLDICVCKRLIPMAQQLEGKISLRDIVRMAVGLRTADQRTVKEETDRYSDVPTDEKGALFAHETLDVYQRGLDLIRWLDEFLQSGAIAAQPATRLDKTSTSLVLNIAEGNGRYSVIDHRRFLDIAQTCAMNMAAALDLLVARGVVASERIGQGKLLLSRLVAMLQGFRGYLSESDQGT